MSMFLVNYALCAILSVAFMDKSGAVLGSHDQHFTVILGMITGAIFLGGFLLLKYNMKHNGMVLAATFLKLGVIIPTVMAVIAFGEIPTMMQIIGITIAIVAIIIIHFDNEDLNEAKSSKVNKKIWLIVLLILGGVGDSMSNIFEKIGPANGDDGYLLVAFLTACSITGALVLFGKKKICKEDILFGLLVGVPNYFSARFLLASLGELEAVIVYPTYSVGMMIVIAIVGVMAFHETISKRKGLSLGLIAVAITLLNI